MIQNGVKFEMVMLTDIFSKAWNTGDAFDSLTENKRMIVLIHKKGDIRNCGNYRVITEYCIKNV